MLCAKLLVISDLNLQKYSLYEVFIVSTIFYKKICYETVQNEVSCSLYPESLYRSRSVLYYSKNSILLCHLILIYLIYAFTYNVSCLFTGGYKNKPQPCQNL